MSEGSASDSNGDSESRYGVDVETDEEDGAYLVQMILSAESLEVLLIAVERVLDTFSLLTFESETSSGYQREQIELSIFAFSHCLLEDIQKHVAAEKKKYSFMVSNYHILPQPKRLTNFLIQEMHKVEDEPDLQIEQGNKSGTSTSKRALEIELEETEDIRATGKKIKN